MGVGGPILTRYPTRDFIFDCFSKSGAEGVYTPHPVPPTPTQSGSYFYIYLIFKEIEGKKKGRNRVGGNYLWGGGIPPPKLIDPIEGDQPSGRYTRSTVSWVTRKLPQSYAKDVSRGSFDEEKRHPWS